MRHRKDGKQFGRNTSHRRAMFRNLAANLINHERILTTDAKAKELRRVAERLITKARRLGSVAYRPHGELSPTERVRRLHVSRLIGRFVPRWGVERDGETRRDLIEKVMVELSQRFAERPGGYTRIVKVGRRRGDGASMSVVEFVDTPDLAELEEQAAEASAAEATDEAEETTAESEPSAEADEQAPEPAEKAED